LQKSDFEPYSDRKEMVMI